MDGTEDREPRTPLVSLVLAYAALLPVVAGAIWTLAGGMLAGSPDRALALQLTVAWAGAVLCFLAGVRRGLSFRQPGGPTSAQLATMFALFVLGASSLVSPWPVVSLLLQVAGYGLMAVLDPIAARRGEAPVYFARLRPVQMALPVISLATLAIVLLDRGP